MDFLEFSKKLFNIVHRSTMRMLARENEQIEGYLSVILAEENQRVWKIINWTYRLARNPWQMHFLDFVFIPNVHSINAGVVRGLGTNTINLYWLHHMLLYNPVCR